MFSNIFTVTKAIFQQFESKVIPNVFDPYQTNQFYEELNQDVYAGSNFDISFSDEEDMVVVVKMMDERDTYFINGYCIEQPNVNRMHLIVATTAKGILKKVSTGASSAYSSANSGKKKLQKKAMNLVSVDKELPVMRGYGVDFCLHFERPYDSGFCFDLSDRKNHRNVDGYPETSKYINIPMKTYSSIETKNDSWELV